jgi:hypothetical protein
MGLFSGSKDWNVVAIMFETKGRLQINGNRAKGPNAEKVRDNARKHSRCVFWAVFNQKRTFLEGGEGAGKDYVTLDTYAYVERNLAKAKGVAQVLTLLEKNKTDKAATAWDVALEGHAPRDDSEE